MPHLKTTALLAALFFLSACVTAKDEHLSKGYRLLSGDEIRPLHLDKTFELKLPSGKTATDYFTADGRSTFRRSDGVTDQGTWEIRGDLVCYVYPKVPATAQNCYTMAVKDGRYVLFKEFPDTKGTLGGEVISITDGNVTNLPLD